MTKKNGNRKKRRCSLGISEKLEIKRQMVKHKDMKFLVETLKDFWLQETGIRKQVERVIQDIIIEHAKEIEYLERILKGEL